MSSVQKVLKKPITETLEEQDEMSFPAIHCADIRFTVNSKAEYFIIKEAKLHITHNSTGKPLQSLHLLSVH